jgi:hypothetical protein
LTPEQIARHEAAHVAMALTVGIPVRSVKVDGSSGEVEYLPHSHTPEGALRRMLVVLAGLAETAPVGGLPRWPLNPSDGPDEERPDRTLLAELAQRLDLTEADYRAVEIEALRLSTTPEYLRLVESITGELGYRPVLDRASLAITTGRVI